MKPRPIEVKKRIWHAPPHGHDKEICANCPNVGKCENPCYPLTWINGDTPRREKLLRDPYTDTIEVVDYNLIFYNLSKTTGPVDRLEEIIKIPLYRDRLIVAGVMVKIPRQNIASLMHMNRKTLHRIIAPMLEK